MSGGLFTLVDFELCAHDSELQQVYNQLQYRRLSLPGHETQEARRPSPSIFPVSCRLARGYVRQAKQAAAELGEALHDAHTVARCLATTEALLSGNATREWTMPSSLPSASIYQVNREEGNPCLYRPSILFPEHCCGEGRGFSCTRWYCTAIAQDRCPPSAGGYITPIRRLRCETRDARVHFMLPQ